MQKDAFLCKRMVKTSSGRRSRFACSVVEIPIKHGGLFPPNRTWWWWEDGVAFRVDQNGQHLPNPPTPPRLRRVPGRFSRNFPPISWQVPFAGGWIGFLGYELGATLDPAFAQFNPPPGLQAAFAWCPELEIEDRLRKSVGFRHAPQAWRHRGELDPQAKDRGSDLCASEWRGRGRCRVACDWARGLLPSQSHPTRVSIHHRPVGTCGSCSFLETGQPRHGADLPLPGGRRVVSVSPESFLVRRGDQLLTRPIKGTRPSDGDPDELLNSAKDAAELHMIVDLLRNDLGRVAVPGEVRVREPRAIERHATVLQTVAEVEATLRPGIGFEDIMAATFPSGPSRCPKIMAMHQLTSSRRAREVLTAALLAGSVTKTLNFPWQFGRPFSSLKPTATDSLGALVAALWPTRTPTKNGTKPKPNIACLTWPSHRGPIKPHIPFPERIYAAEYCSRLAASSTNFDK